MAPIRRVHSEKLLHRSLLRRTSSAVRPETLLPSALRLQARVRCVDDLPFPARAPSQQLIPGLPAHVASATKHFLRGPRHAQPRAPSRLCAHQDRRRTAFCRCKSPALPQAADSISKFDRPSSATARPPDLPHAIPCSQSRGNYASMEHLPVHDRGPQPTSSRCRYAPPLLSEYSLRDRRSSTG